LDNKTELKIVFMGTPSYATEIFKTLLQNDYKVTALFTQPDKPVGRKQVVTPPHIKQYCIDENLDIDIYQPTTLKTEEAQEQIKSLNPSLIIVAAYGQILPKAILDIAPCINLHASLLPKYRGASPIQESLLQNDGFTGVTAMMMDVGLDSGDILGLKYLKIESQDVGELFEELSTIASELTIEVIKRINNINPKKQLILDVSHCGKIKKSDGEITFDSAHNLYTKYRAYKFWPGVFLESGLKLKELELHETTSTNKPGSILESTKEYIVVGCTQGSIKLFALQPPSKKQIRAVDYLRGKEHI
jgi:methionyl-tRNA formyltransferase